jgi:carbon-monoxide dehydrogenase small subunit
MARTDGLVGRPPSTVARGRAGGPGSSGAGGAAGFERCRRGGRVQGDAGGTAPAPGDAGGSEPRPRGRAGARTLLLDRAVACPIPAMSDHDVSLTVDGTEETLQVPARKLLVHALRDAGYTAPQVGCESGKCGACTVLVDGDAVKSCTRLAVQADGAEITTAAGLADEGLTEVQSAFQAEHGLQCGYCTPGMLATTHDLLADDPDPDRETIRTALKGNVCRCTGYQNVVDAVETAAARRGGE